MKSNWPKLASLVKTKRKKKKKKKKKKKNKLHTSAVFSFVSVFIVPKGHSF